MTGCRPITAHLHLFFSWLLHSSRGSWTEMSTHNSWDVIFARYEIILVVFVCEADLELLMLSVRPLVAMLKKTDDIMTG